ncbi:MAG: DUF2059 domain-containing protein [Pseudomonadota bacterium]
MKRVLLAALALFVLPLLAAHAQDKPSDDHVKAAREMLRLSQADKMFNGVLPILLKQQVQYVQSIRPNITPEALKRFEEVFDERAKKAVEIVLVQVAEIYAGKFTEAEIAEISAFYNSDVGRKMIATKPELTKDAMSVGIAWGQNIGSELGKEVLRQLKEEGHKL